MVGVVEAACGERVRKVEVREAAGGDAVIEAGKHKVGVAAGECFIAITVEREPPRIGFDEASPSLGGSSPHAEARPAGEHGPIVGQALPRVAGKLRHDQMRQEGREPVGRRGCRECGPA